MHLSTIQRAPCVPQTQMPSARRSHYTRLKDGKVTTSNLALYRQRACSSASSAKTSRGPLSLTRKSRRIRVIHSVTARLLFSSAPRVRAFLLSSLFKYKSFFFCPCQDAPERNATASNRMPTPLLLMRPSRMTEHVETTSFSHSPSYQKKKKKHRCLRARRRSLRSDGHATLDGTRQHWGGRLNPGLIIANASNLYEGVLLLSVFSSFIALSPPAL